MGDFANTPIEARWRQQVQPVPVVAAIIPNGDEEPNTKYLLIKRISDPYKGYWALVGGKWDFGETLATAITREIEEETGLDTEMVAARGVVNEHMHPAAGKGEAAHFLIFVCELRVVDGVASEQEEGIVGWFTLAEIDQLLKDGRIIASDHAMIQTFADSNVSIPLIEAEMSSGRDQETELKRFEYVGNWLKE